MSEASRSIPKNMDVDPKVAASIPTPKSRAINSTAEEGADDAKVLSAQETKFECLTPLFHTTFDRERDTHTLRVRRQAMAVITTL